MFENRLFSRLLTGALSVSLLLTLSACSRRPGKQTEDGTTTTRAESTVPTTSAAPQTDPSVESSSTGTAITAPSAVPTTVAPTTAAPVPTTVSAPLPQTSDEILALYDTVMSDLKRSLDAKTATCRRKEYQEISDLNFGAASSIAQGIVDRLVTPAGEATPELLSDSSAVPPYSADGCALEGAGFVRSATAVDNGDGTATLTIVLNNEQNPQPPEGGVHTSETGKLFSPVKTSEITNTFTGIPMVGKALDRFDLNYHDCTATLIYEKESGRVRSLEQIMYIDLDAHVSVLSGIDLSAKVTNHVEIGDIVYQ